MSGFVEARYEEKPRMGKRNKQVSRMWIAIERTTGTPPSLIHYHPPRRSGCHQVLSSWVIHHETGTFTFKGPSPQIVSFIEENGLIELEESA